MDIKLLSIFESVLSLLNQTLKKAMISGKDYSFIFNQEENLHYKYFDNQPLKSDISDSHSLHTSRATKARKR